MSAAEKLKALDARYALMEDEDDGREIVWVVLPQIVAVVSEQEHFSENMWTVQNGDDAEPFVSPEGLRYLREHLARAATALAALDEQLGDLSSATEPEAPTPPPNVCPYCAGKGGRHRAVASRFLGTGTQVHDGPWENCWKCGGTGALDEALT